MIYNIITDYKNRKIFRTVVSFVIIAFTFSLSSCYTSETVTVNPGSVYYEPYLEIVQVILNSGLVINLKDKNAKYVRSKNAIVYGTADDTVRINPNVYNLKSSTKIIRMEDIKSVIVNKEVNDAAMSIIATLGIIAGLLIIAAVIVAATKESCPFIYSFDGEKYVFDGEPYGGAIAEGLKKTDYSRLEDLKEANGKYKLLMRNEADETQHTDEVKLLVIDHPENTEVAPDISGNMFVFEKSYPVISVTDESKNEITSFFNKKDNVQWQTDMPGEAGLTTDNLRHELIFKFPKPKEAKKVKLLINAGTALWGGYMIKEMLNMRGDKVDEWIQDINIKGPELSKLYNFMDREELYSLKAKIYEDGEWITKGSVSACGPFLDEDRIIELNIENVKGDTLLLKLSPPYGYWKFDYAGVIYESSNECKITELNLSFAENEKGQDLRDSLSATDGKYYSMPDSASIAKLEFDVPDQTESMNRSLFMKTSGYYDIHLKKDHQEQTELIEKVYNTPGLILEISMNEYIKKIRSLGSTK